MSVWKELSLKFTEIQSKTEVKPAKGHLSSQCFRYRRSIEFGLLQSEDS